MSFLRTHFCIILVHGKVALNYTGMTFGHDELMNIRVLLPSMEFSDFTVCPGHVVGMYIHCRVLPREIIINTKTNKT